MPREAIIAAIVLINAAILLSGWALLRAASDADDEAEAMQR